MTTARRLALVPFTLAACVPEFDSTRTPVDTGSFGETVVTLTCKRLAYQAELADGGLVEVSGDRLRDACRGGVVPDDAPATVAALLGDRAALVEAIDTAVPAAYRPTLQAFLTSPGVLALYDDDTLGTSMTQLADLLTEVGSDEPAMAALARMQRRTGYRPVLAAHGALAEAARSSAFDPVLVGLLPAINPGGAAHTAWRQVVAASSATLRGAAPLADPAAPDRTGALALELLLAERADLGGDGPVRLARRDHRGVARIAWRGSALPAPYVDGDGDGLADVDLAGDYVDAAGQPIASPAPFALPDAGDVARDGDGRALSGDGEVLHEYVDVDRTVLAALVRDAAPLFDPARGTGLDLMRGASALLGPRIEADRQLGDVAITYPGYDTSQSPLLDLAHAYVQLLGDPDIDVTLHLLDRLLAEHEPALARLVEAAITSARIGDAHPEATIAADQPLWDDFMVVARKIAARPALVGALLKALEKPEVAELRVRLAQYMTYKDRFDIDANQAVVGSFTTMVDRQAADSGFNRSLWQRLLHMIADARGARMCNKADAHVAVGPITYPLVGGYDPCELVEVDDLAVFYVRSMAYAKDASGNVVCEDDNGEAVACTAAGARPRPAAELVFKDPVVNAAINVFGDDFLENQSTIAGFRRHPTTAAIHRVLFLSPMPDFLAEVLDPVLDREGDRFDVQHVGTVPVWERDNFFDQIRPIAQAFVDDGSELLLVELLAALHQHWPTAASADHQTTDPAADDHVAGSGGNSYERQIVDVLATDLIPAIVAAAPELNAISIDGRSFPTIAAGTLSYLVTPRAGLADRLGHTTSTTADGRPVTTLSPWDLLADAANRKRARLLAVGAEGTQWTDSITELIDTFVRADPSGDLYHFRNPRLPGVARAVIVHVRDRLAAHTADRAAWVATGLPSDITDLLTHPVTAAIADLGVGLAADPAARTALDALVFQLVTEAGAPDTFATTTLAVADLLQFALSDADVVPIARLAGTLLGPDRSYLDTELALVDRLRAADSGMALAALVGQLFGGLASEPDETAIGKLIDRIGDVQRVAPSADAGKPWSVEDYRAVLTGTAGFLREQQRGFPRFIAIVKGRHP